MNLAGIFPTSLSVNGRRFLLAQAVSNTFTWGTRFAVAWWIYQLSHSNWMLGVAAFAGQGFSLAVIPVAGILADRFGMKRLYLATQAGAMLQVALLLLLAASGKATLPFLLTLCALRGVLFALEQPARDAMAGELAPFQALPAVVSLQGVMVQIARIAGPALAAALIKLAGIWSCFALDFISYIPAIAALRALLPSIPAPAPDSIPTGWWEQMRYGWKSVLSSPVLTRAVLLLACLNLLGLPVLTVLPALVQSEFRGSSLLLGAFITASGAGAIAANILCVRLRQYFDPQVSLSPALLLTGFALIVLSAAHRPLLALVAMFLSGFAAMCQITGTSILLQSQCQRGCRGRVMAVYGAASWGIAPFASLLIGRSATAAGLRPCVFFYGLTALVIGQIASVIEYSAALIPQSSRTTCRLQ